MAAAEAEGAQVLVHDVPLLVEGGLAPGYHLVLVVDAPVEQRLARLLVRSALDESQVRARMAAQASPEARRAAADVWIDNGRDLTALDAEIGALWRDRLAPYAQNLAARVRAPRAPGRCSCRLTRPGRPRRRARSPASAGWRGSGR